MVDSQTRRLAKELGIDMDAGHINVKDKRFRLHCGSAYPAADARGYALRARVVWWLNTGELITGLKWNIHHINGERADDRFCNLEKLDHVAHAREHNPRRRIKRICKGCKQPFEIKPYRLKEKGRGSYCSQECYHAHPRSDQHRKNMSIGLKRSYKERGL